MSWLRWILRKLRMVYAVRMTVIEVDAATGERTIRADTFMIKDDMITIADDAGEFANLVVTRVGGGIIDMELRMYSDKREAHE